MLKKTINAIYFSIFLIRKNRWILYEQYSLLYDFFFQIKVNCKGSQEKYGCCFGPEESISLKLQFHHIKSSPKCVQIHTLISCGAVFKRDFCVCSLVILPCLPSKQTGKQAAVCVLSVYNSLCKRGDWLPPHGGAGCIGAPPPPPLWPAGSSIGGCLYVFQLGFAIEYSYGQ